MPDRTRTPDHKPCPFCDHGLNDNSETGDPTCPDCQGTGMAITWAARAALIGGHYHVTIWAGRKGSRAGLGKLVMDADDWAEFQLQVATMTPPMEIIERHSDPDKADRGQ